MSIAGVDGCKGGWLAVIQAGAATPLTVYLFQTFGDIFISSPDLRIVAVDIPIGLPANDVPTRACDKEARQLLGKPRSSSVFPAPVREIIGIDRYEEANAASRSLRGKGISKQAFAIMPKIQEVDQVVRRYGQELVKEVHPEVSFFAMGGDSMKYPKRRLKGRAERRGLLVTHLGQDFVRECEDAFGGLRAKADDLYDAMAALWSAKRLVEGRAKTIPINPPKDSTGLRMEINY